MHATDSGTSSLSHALLSSLRCDTMDPDLAQVIDKRRSTTGSGQNPGSRQSLAQGSGVSIAKGPVPPHAAKSEERDRLYFVLLEKAAKLECEKSDLQGQLESLRSDAKAYEEVALELEADLKTATTENKKKRAEIATLKATDKQSEARLPMARLAEDVVTALQARPRRYSQLSLPSLGDDAPISDDAISMGSARLDLHAGTRTDSVQETFDALSGLHAALLMRRDEQFVVQAHHQDIAMVGILPFNSFTRRQPWSLRAAADSVFSTSTGSVYSSTSPFEKASSILPPFRRCSSVPTTLGEQMAAKARSTDLQYPAGCDAVERPTPVQANHLHNSSMRHVSDTRNFWRVFMRQKFNQILGFQRRTRAPVCRYLGFSNRLESVM